MEAREELGYWYPAHVLPDLPEQLPIPLPRGSWVRLLPDPAAALPSVRVQLAWITRPVLHLVIVSGFTLAEEDDDSDEDVRIVAHERVSLQNMQRVHLDMDTGAAMAEFSDREDLPGAPGLLLNKYLNGPEPDVG